MTDPAPPTVQGLPEDFREFLTLVKIRTKAGGKLVTPVLNDEQEELDAAWNAGELDEALRNMLVLKPRQIGVTTYFALLFLHKFLTSPDPVTLVMLAHEQKTATLIMRMIKVAIASLPAALRPKLTTNQVRTISREDPNIPGADGATLIVETAGASGVGRGNTIFWLLISEANFCKDPEEVKASAIGAIPAGGRLVMESTAKHVGDVLHVEMQRAQAGATDMPWQTKFFAWHQHEEYRSPVAPGFERTEDEEALAARYDLADEQLAWRRQQIAKYGEKRFRREFPADIADAYSSLEGQWFQQQQIEHVQVVDIQPTGSIQLEPPDPRESYCAAVDAAAGVGGDATTCVILMARTARVVAIYRSTEASPMEGVDSIWHLLMVYNNAQVLVERNSYGIPYLNSLRALRANMYTERSHETDGQQESGEDRDFVTNEKTRVEVLEDFRSVVLAGGLPLIDSICREEMLSAKLDKNGKVMFPRSKKNGHGDVLMAYALALRCRRHVRIPEPPPAPSVVREREIKRQRALSRVARPGARY